MNPRLGYILMFSGDKRKLKAVVENASTFTAQSGVMVQGSSDVTATYCSSSVTSLGNILVTHLIGGQASIPPGNYRYYISGTYSGNKRTGYWEIQVLPKDLSLITEYTPEDYEPFIEEVTKYEGDNFDKAFTPGVTGISAATGVFQIDATDKTSTYCSSSATVNAAGDAVTTHNIGSVTTIPAADYGYFLTLTYDNAETVATWFYRVKVLPKQSII